MKVEYVYKNNKGNVSVEMDQELLHMLIRTIKNELYESILMPDPSESVELARVYSKLYEYVEEDTEDEVD